VGVYALRRMRERQRLQREAEASRQADAAAPVPARPEPAPPDPLKGFPLRAALVEAGIKTLEAIEDASEEVLMAVVKTYRRYLRFKALAARVRQEEALFLAWKTKLEAEPAGTPLPLVNGETFPASAELAAHELPYRFVEDLTGADVAELVEVTGIGKKTAEKILAALPAQ
jgi:hypothetical protein